MIYLLIIGIGLAIILTVMDAIRTMKEDKQKEEFKKHLERQTLIKHQPENLRLSRYFWKGK